VAESLEEYGMRFSRNARPKLRGLRTLGLRLALLLYLHLGTSRFRPSQRDDLVFAGRLPLAFSLHCLVAAARPALHSAMDPRWSRSGEKSEGDFQKSDVGRWIVTSIAKNSLGG